MNNVKDGLSGVRTPRQYDFDDRLAMSHGVSENAEISSILIENIPGALNAYQSHTRNDKQGTDWWVEHCTSRHLSVDCKVRSQDYSLKGHDDLALESWSVIEANRVGWTRDDNKRSDYILWLWTDTKRWCLIPFPMLCSVMIDHWEQWRKDYKFARQHTPSGMNGYHSECIFVPRKIVWRAIFNKFSGQPVT